MQYITSETPSLINEPGLLRRVRHRAPETNAENEFLLTSYQWQHPHLILVSLHWTNLTAAFSRTHLIKVTFCRYLLAPSLHPMCLRSSRWGGAYKNRQCTRTYSACDQVVMTPSPPCDKNYSTRWCVGKLRGSETVGMNTVKLSLVMEGRARS